MNSLLTSWQARPMNVQRAVGGEVSFPKIRNWGTFLSVDARYACSTKFLGLRRPALPYVTCTKLSVRHLSLSNT